MLLRLFYLLLSLFLVVRIKMLIDGFCLTIELPLP